MAVFGVLPLGLDRYWLFVVSSALVLALACLSLNLLLGYTGLLSLGHATYFGVGAYAGAFLFTFGRWQSLEVHLVSGVVCAAVLAAALGFLCVAATRIYFSILTLAFAQTVHSLFISGAVFRPLGAVGKHFYLVGNGGLYIPQFRIAGVALPPTRFETAFYYVILLAVLVGAGLMWRVVNSPFGRALCAIRDNETRAACIGIPVRSYRWRVYVIAGVFAGLAGGLFGQLDRQVTPDQLYWLFSAELVVACILGGTRHFAGPAVGAFVVVGLREIALRFSFYHSLLLGAMLLAVIRAFPGGLTEGALMLLARLGRRVGPPRS